MTKRNLRLLTAALALATAPLLGQAPKTEIPKPPAELSQLQFFIGTWACTGTGFASPMAPEHPTSATVRGTSAVGGMWIHLTYDEKTMDSNPMPIHAAMYMGYDAERKEFLLGCVDSLGGRCTETSKGWNGDTMVFEGTGSMGGQKAGSRDTFVKKGAGQLTHTGEMQGPDGKWTKLDEETCKRGK